MKTNNHIAYGAAVAVMSAIGLTEGGQPAEWIQVIPMGKFGGRDGRGPYVLESAAHAAQVIATTRAYAGSAEPGIDYDHQHDLGVLKGAGNRAPASGWFKDFEVRDDGIWGKVDWTASAHAQLTAKEYRYFSPVFTHDRNTGRVSAILRGGLTNAPNLDLVAVASQLNETDAEASDQGKTMKLSPAVAAALGLTEAASEQDTLGAITGLKAGQDGLATVAHAAGLPKDAATSTIVTAVSTAIAGATPDPTKFVPADQVVAIQSQLTALQGQVSKDKAETAVDAAIAAGKIVPTLRDHFIAVHSADPAKFAEFESKAPVVVQPGQKDPGQATEVTELTVEDKAVCAAMNLTEAEFLEAKKGGL